MCAKQCGRGYVYSGDIKDTINGKMYIDSTCDPEYDLGFTYLDEGPNSGLRKVLCCTEDQQNWMKYLFIS